ncbi:unnamed protein product [Diamesa serratosioi]
MNKSLALTLLIVVLANYVTSQVPPVRTPVRPPVVGPVRPPVRPPVVGPQIGPVRPPVGRPQVGPVRPPNGSNIVIPTRSTRAPTPQTISITNRAPPAPTRPTIATSQGVQPSTRPPPVGPSRPPPVTTTKQNNEVTTQSTIVPTPTPPAPSPNPPQPPVSPVLPLIPLAPIVTRVPTMTTLPPNVKTTLPPRVGPGVPDPRCPPGSSVRNPVQLPHHDDCSRFFKCDHGMAFEHRCPVGQHWNAARNWCDFPNLAGCSTNGNVQLPVDGPITIPMAPPVSSPNPAGVPDIRCPHTPTSESPIGEKNLPHLGNCNMYLKCVQGLAYEGICPYGQHWNTARESCDMPQSANCQVGRK